MKLVGKALLDGVLRDNRGVSRDCGFFLGSFEQRLVGRVWGISYCCFSVS